MKRLLIGLCAGTALGFAIALLVGPASIEWWYSPPEGAGGFSCNGPVRWAVTRFLYIQLVLALFGAVLGGTVAVLGRRKAVQGGSPPAP